MAVSPDLPGRQQRARLSLHTPANPEGNALLRLLEEDRQRLARELHDETGQILAATLFKLDHHLAELPVELEKTAHEIQDIRASIVAASRDLRGLVYRLYPPMLAEHGLAPTLRWLVRQFSAQYPVVATIEAPDDSRLPMAMELAIFRIVQEALTNVAKHSQARNVAVRVVAERARVVVEVQDDGVGFDLSAVANREIPGFGLVGMRARAREFHGDVELRSTPGAGTTISAQLRRKDFAHGSDSDHPRRRSPGYSAGVARGSVVRAGFRNRGRSRRRPRSSPDCAPAAA